MPPKRCNFGVSFGALAKCSWNANPSQARRGVRGIDVNGPRGRAWAANQQGAVGVCEGLMSTALEGGHGLPTGKGQS
jgi:hypothetical protein